MKYILTFILLISFGAFSSIQAQQRSLSQPGLQHFIIQYGDVLELTDQQKSELLLLQADRRSTMQDNRQRGAMTGQRGQMTRQQPALRGQQRGALRFNTDRNQRGRSVQAMRLNESRTAVSDILTTDQQAKLLEIRGEQIKERSELLKFRNKTLVEHSITDPQKAEEVISSLNRMVEIRMKSQLYRLESRGETDPEIMVEYVTEIRSIQNELMDEMTVAEFKSLRPVFTSGMQRHRAEGRRAYRNR